jgi:hypothetical protein
MLRTGLLTLLLLSPTALAQEAAPAPAPAAVPAPSRPPVLAAPDDRTVTVNDDDEIIYQSRRLTPRELFEVAGRPDLVAQADANVARRTALFISAGAVAAVAVVVGVILYATGPNFGAEPCNKGFDTVADRLYFDTVCIPQNTLHMVSGSLTLVGGLAAAGLLAAFGFWARPDVLTPFELHRFIRDHNAALSGPRVTLRVSPWVSPWGAGLSARATF